jgi:hypothetical protein
MPRKPKSRIAELAEAEALMRDIRLSDDAAEIQALLAFLRAHARARVWLRSLIRDDHLSAWASACQHDDGTALQALGVGARVARELAQRSQSHEYDHAFGGLSELQILLLIRRFSGRKPRISFADFLVLQLWQRLLKKQSPCPAPLPLADATLELWRRTIGASKPDGFQRLGHALTLLQRPRAGKRPVQEEWRLDVLRYVLRNPKAHYTVAELRRTIPTRYAPHDRKDVLNFCRANGIGVGRTTLTKTTPRLTS